MTNFFHALLISDFVASGGTPKTSYKPGSAHEVEESKIINMKAEILFGITEIEADFMPWLWN